MPIDVTCAGCGTTHQAEDQYAGQWMQCPCGTALQVPGRTAAAPRQQPPQRPAQPQQPARPSGAYSQSSVPMASGSLGGYGFKNPSLGMARAAGSVDVLAIMETIAASLLIIHSVVMFILHLIDWIDVLDFASAFDFDMPVTVWLAFFLHLVGFVVCLATLGFGICVLVESIARLAKGRVRIAWAKAASAYTAMGYVGLRLLFPVVVIIAYFEAKSRAKEAMQRFNDATGRSITREFKIKFPTSEFMEQLGLVFLLGIAPVFFLVIFILRVKKNRRSYKY